MERYDAVVVGGGTAGCVLAARLSEDDGRTVCLIEAGPDYGPHAGGGWPDDMLDALSVPDSHDWTDAQGRLSVARIIGGCSSHNFCVAMVPRPEDYDDWDLPGWSGADLAPHIQRVMGTLPLHRFEEGSLNPWYRAVREAAAKIGLPVHDDLNAPEVVEGIGPIPLNVRGTTRWNASFAYLDPARGRENLTVLADTTVERIELEGDRATAIVARTPDGRRELSADTIVLAAGAYNSPALLMRSGIGPENELARHGIEVALDLPVGERLREHFGVPVRFAASEEMGTRVAEYLDANAPFPFNGVIKARTSASPEGRWDLILLLALFPGPVLSTSAMLMRPEWTGAVHLRSADPRDLPIVSELSLDSDRDAKAAFEGIQLARGLAASEALSELIAEELAPGADATPATVRSLGREGLTTFFHPVGTCPMEEGGVTDPDGRLKGIENLYLADASILPDIPPVPTNITVLAAAEKIAAGIRDAPSS